jgi:nucleoside-diphosphate-sugar epimerase
VSTHLVIGAGPVGSEVARLLAGDGHDVVVVTRHGSGPSLAGVRIAGGANWWAPSWLRTVHQRVGLQDG